ncbi:MAG: immune inhibitor A, partial [Bacteroidetes bacterium]|nr:immune inhibitor A [Bacteroidota bacterium]
RVSMVMDETALPRLGLAGIPLEDVLRRKTGDIELVLSPAEIARLRGLGFSLSILDSNVSRTYAHRAQRSLLKAGSNPSHFVQQFHLGSMAGFMTLAELDATVDSMLAAYPLLISGRDTIGFSVEGRPIWSVKISRNPDLDEPEPRVLYTAVHHAREPQGMMTLLFTMWYLLENYGSDVDVTDILDHRELFFVPLLNPDGYAYNQKVNPEGGGMWRKNRRPNIDSSLGVDLNRNYGYAWGYDDVGSSKVPAHETFRGLGPFSEPETAALRDFCIEKEFSVALNYHAFANVLIHPWGHRNNVPPDSAVFQRLGTLVTRRNYYPYGTGAKTIGYPTNGDSDDWMYGDTLTKPAIFAMTSEVGSADDGFWPAPERILPLAEENLGANLALARLAGECFKAEVASIRQQSDNDTIEIRLSVNSIGVREPSAGITVHFSGTRGETVFPSSAFVPITSSSPFAVTVLRDHARPDGAPATLLVRMSSTQGHSRDSVRFRLGVPVLAFEDTVGGDDGWWTSVTTRANFVWETTDAESYSGRYSYTDSPKGDYERDLTSVLVLQKPILLAGAAAELRFRSKWDIEAAYDMVVVEGSGDQGRSWTALSGDFTRPGSGVNRGKQVLDVPGFDRTQKEWVEEVMDLQDYVGTDFRLRFRLDSDEARQRDGIYVDDIRILLYQTHTLTVPPETLPLTTQLFQNFPNPFNGETRISFVMGGPPGGREDRMRATLKVYDVLGREVATVVEGLFPPGSHSVRFDARGLASGVYWYRLQDGSTAVTRPMILLR